MNNPRLNEALSASVAEAWNEVAGVASKTYPASVELFQQGAQAQEVYLIKSGLVKLTRLRQDGRELILDLTFAGQLLGSAAAIVQRPHPATAITLTRCSLLCIPSPFFHKALRNNVTLSRYLHQVLSHEVCDELDRVAQLGLFSARQRLEDLLWQLVSVPEFDATAGEARLQLPLKYWEVAQLIAVTPPYLCQLFHELEGEQILHRRKGWLIIPNPQKLWHAGS
jgi:CRP/FNR family cyclic AMP-dependent transcriptional regulator